MTKDISIKAAEHRDLDAACRVVQEFYGQTDGGIAGDFFSGDEGDEYSTATLERRIELMDQYCRLEAVFAGGKRK